jgi:hypothetical protein
MVLVFVNRSDSEIHWVKDPRKNMDAKTLKKLTRIPRVTKT